MPRLFQNGPSKEDLAALARQRAFARDRVLGKRPLDEVPLETYTKVKQTPYDECVIFFVQAT